MKKIKKSSEEKAFERMVGKLKKEFKGNLSTLSDNLKESSRVSVEFIPTGCLALDVALGGGWAKGRIIEVAGGESTGKTTLTDTTIAKAQKMGLICAKVDAEHATDPKYLKALGVNFDTLIFSQPETGEQALDQLLSLVKAGVDLITVDSVAALVPSDEYEKGMDKNTMGGQARMMGKVMRKLTARVGKSGSCVIFINQLRDKMNVRFGDKSDTPGGKALKFWASQRVRLANLGAVKSHGVKSAKKIKAIVKKSKVAPNEGRMAEYQIEFGKGINKDLDLWDTLAYLDLATRKTKSGEKKTYIAGEKYFDFEDFQEKLKKVKGLRKTLIKMIREHKDDVIRDVEEEATE